MGLLTIAEQNQADGHEQLFGANPRTRLDILCRAYPRNCTSTMNCCRLALKHDSLGPSQMRWPPRRSASQSSIGGGFMLASKRTNAWLLQVRWDCAAHATQLQGSRFYAAEEEIVPDSISRKILRSTEASSSRLTWLLRNCTRT